jgi:carboxypeptidase T
MNQSMRTILTIIIVGLILITPSGASSMPERSGMATADRGVVARIYYADRAELAQLTGRLDIWEVHRDQGYVIAALSVDEWQRLATQGYRVQLEAEMTVELYRPRVNAPGQINGIPSYPCYRTVEETYTTAQNIVTQHPTLAQWIDIGDSWQKTRDLGGYDLRVLKLTNQNSTAPKAKLFVMSSVHAREYAPAELNTRFAEYLISHYGVDADVTWLLDYTEIHLLLQSNPDGRKFAEIGYYWRKNTNQNYCGATSTNRGADLNRNWPFMWNSCAPGDGCSSGVMCYEDYRGPSAASEPETQSTVAYVRSIFPDQRPVDDLTTPVPVTATGLFMDLHSYSQLVLWPWGFTYSLSPNATALQTLGRKFAYFNSYTPQQSVGLYPTDGTTDDTAYGELGVAAYTFEVGTSFFQACTTFENTLLPNNLPALLYAAKAARRPYQTPAGPDVLNVTVTPTSTTGSTVLMMTLNATATDTRFNNNNGAEPTQSIAAARYTVDAPSWITNTVTYSMTATDGAFNTSSEALTAAVNAAGWSVERHTLFVEAQDANGNWGVPTAIYLEVVPDAVQGGMPQLMPEQQTGAGTPGSNVIYPLGVKNVGAFTDTFTLTIAGNGWPTTLGVTQALLAPNELVTVPLTVTIPVTAPIGAVSDVSITATSLLDSASAVVRTSILYAGHAVYLPLINDQ